MPDWPGPDWPGPDWPDPDWSDPDWTGRRGVVSGARMIAAGASVAAAAADTLFEPKSGLAAASEVSVAAFVDGRTGSAGLTDPIGRSGTGYAATATALPSFKSAASLGRMKSGYTTAVTKAARAPTVAKLAPLRNNKPKCSTELRRRRVSDFASFALDAVDLAAVDGLADAMTAGKAMTEV